MARDIDIDQLVSEITRSVQEYTDDVEKGIDQHLDEVAEKVRQEAETSAPKHTGKYAKGFKVSDQSKGTLKRLVVWNKKHSRRVHLLEFGHAKRGGGRVRAYPHLRPAYEHHAAHLVDDIKRIIRNGGR
ncbi:HK97 gp10 family phage protein [Paenibacillus polymyxa]|uniref:HK97 gp10 family phage protein n=1 Tax=Paenibacillus polymyxa TaxID=1406 RepID=UPI0024C03607|nr:HK97 gp10 family phage protein [Paenibacillus polymyxa]WHX35270.1 HK97 gp10 family phage protein [Paenibacillus polymyxa]